MKLLVQPDDGVMPLVSAIQMAQSTIDQVIFRFDLPQLEKAMRAAVTRGVVTRTLIAHTNQSGEKKLRALELRLLADGLTVTRSGEEFLRYHGKMMIVDRSTLYLLGFNYTTLDIERSRSFGVITKKRKLVQEAIRLFEADCTRQPYDAGSPDLVVSPVNARQRLSAFIRGARHELLIYDPKLSDPLMLRLLQDRIKAGVDVRVLGGVGKRGAFLKAERLRGIRVHVRTIIGDGRRAFVGSQSMRKLELDGRREVGIIVRDPKVVKKLRATFEADWATTPLGQSDATELSGGNQAAVNA
ncbi:MAG: Phosphatidylserine/phosphatidylglycerophosphate/cardiolipin synthase -like [Deltaproteobacteria bacterium]|nr:Phosphatidylserine/phosphatidylglycerophosphate/cardiolipin synthase -like [Deltaproteobacteria bacterium]